jgi:hypothetical protein
MKINITCSVRKIKGLYNYFTIDERLKYYGSLGEYTFINDAPAKPVRQPPTVPTTPNAVLSLVPMLAFHLPAGSNVQNKTGTCSALSTCIIILMLASSSSKPSTTAF